MLRRKDREVPELNTTSTADISFMLLIFFLVVSSLDIDKGIARALPPADQHEQRDELLMEKSKVMQIEITAEGQVTIDNNKADMNDVEPRVVAFIKKVGKEHVITLDVSPEADYATYFELQDHLLAAYRLVRNATSQRCFGTEYARLSTEQRDSIREICPQRVYETYNLQPVVSNH